MSEQKTEKKKPGIVKRIFKWFGLGLLALLLIAAIYLQAPWKVTTLLVIILAACTILPKPARKWFWLSAAAVVIALVIWVFLPDGNGNWRRYTFDEELTALNNKYAIPDKENAAVVYNELLENYDANALKLNFLNRDQEQFTMRNPWSGADYPELAQWLKQHEGTIAKLLEVSEKEKCRFPINANLLKPMPPLNRLSRMRSWARLLVRAANNDLAEGRINQALERQIALLQMGKHQRQQAMPIDLMVGIGIEALAIRGFNRFIITCNPTEQRINVIEEALAKIKHDWSSDWPGILEHEKLTAKNFWGIFYEVNPEGKVRFIRSLFRLLQVNPEQLGLEESPPYSARKLFKAHTILMWFYIPSTPRKAAKIIDQSYEKLYAMAQSDFNWKKEPKKVSYMPIRVKFNFPYLAKHRVEIIEGSYYRIHDYYLYVIRDKRACRLIIALRRYKDKNGSWPESLDEIKSSAPAELFIDPINGGSFVYRLTEENFTLYSKGKNNIDENGKNEQHYGGKDRADDWLIWPRRSRKTKEKNTDAQQQ